jgi:dihydroorotase
MKQSDFWLINGRDVNGVVKHLYISQGLISKISDELPATGDLIDCSGKVYLPGFVDLHTHLRQPGKESAETIATGSAAAALGGFTAISAMANTQPVADTAGVVEQVHRLGREAGLTDVHPVGAVTAGLEGERLAELGAMADSAARVRIFSDDGKCVHDPMVMRRALEYVKRFDGIIAQHAQEPKLTKGAQANEGQVSSDLGLVGWPKMAEEAIIARDILIAEHVDSRLHICHLTSAGGVELVKAAKARGVKVTAEVTPHHLLLTDELVRTFDPVYKVNPPLRTERDLTALRNGVLEGVIDVIGTDHAPHPAEDKDCEWSVAAFGMLGLENAFAVVVTALYGFDQEIDWSVIAKIFSKNPARIAGYLGQGEEIAIGRIANLVVVDGESISVVDRASAASKSSNNPYLGMKLRGAVIHTIYQGILVVSNQQLTGYNAASNA